MTTTIKAHFDGQTIVPDEPVELPLNEPLTLRVEVARVLPPSMTGPEILASGLVGLWKDRTDIGDTLDYARELRRRAEIRGGGQ